MLVLVLLVLMLVLQLPIVVAVVIVVVVVRHLPVHGEDSDGIVPTIRSVDKPTIRRRLDDDKRRWPGTQTQQQIILVRQCIADGRKEAVTVG